MIEAGMFVALGFLAATLIGLMILPAIARRADRLARRRAEAAFPLSLEQVAAERDHLRAELAVRERSYERAAAGALAARADALTEVGKRDTEIGALAETLRQRAARIAELEGALADMTGDRDRTAARLADEIAAHAATRETLERLEENVARLDSLLHQRNEDIGALTRRREMLEQELAGLKSELAASGARLEETGAALVAMTEERDALSAALAAARQEKAELDQAFMARGQELDEERRLAALHAGERDTARLERQQAAGQAAELERTQADIGRRLSRLQAELLRDQTAFGEKLKRAEEKAQAAQTARQTAEKSLVQLREERARLKQEAQAAKRDRDRLQASIGSENATLRSEIVKLARAIAERNPDGLTVAPPPPANAEGSGRKMAAKTRSVAAS